jgi:hypothetical protein
MSHCTVKNPIENKDAVMTPIETKDAVAAQFSRTTL